MNKPEPKPTKMDLSSRDVAADKREELKRSLGQAFPEVFAESAIDFDQLRRVLGEWVDPGKERFGLSWPGKAECMKIIQQPSVATLKPVREESVNFDTTENLFIEGDNLEVLKLLQKAYFGKVRVIYIDPPYNTGNEFIYPDRYAETLETYLAYTGQADDEGRKFSTNTDAVGRFHSNWLNMMYPRLYLARNLLRDDGVIFISIDDNEQDNLKKLGNEIFGEENLVAVVPRIAKRTSDKGTFFRPTKDYVLVWAKNISSLPEFGVQKVRDEADYDLSDEDGRKYKQSGASLFQPSLDSRPNQRYYIEAPDKSLIIPPGNVFPEEKKDGAKVKPQTNNDKVWRWSVETYLKQKDLLIFTKGSSKNPLLDEHGKQSKWNVYPKVYFDEDVEATLHPEDVIYDFPNSQGTKELNALSIPFSFAKPTGLISFLLKLIKGEDDIILDFFAGSATTAHAVMKLNAEDGVRRRFIMVQLPEPTPEDSESRNAGFKTIAEIARQRIRAAADTIGNKHAEGLDLDGARLDLGFKSFKLDRSNFSVWNGGTTGDAEDLVGQIEMHIDHLSAASTAEEVLYELLLKAGFPLTTEIKTIKLAGKDVFSVEGGALLICLEKEITPELIDAMADANPLQVVCLDEGFKSNDQLKANAVQTFRARAEAEESEIVFKTV